MYISPQTQDQPETAKQMTAITVDLSSGNEVSLRMAFVASESAGAAVFVDAASTSCFSGPDRHRDRGGVMQATPPNLSSSPPLPPPLPTQRPILFFLFFF